MTGCCYINIEQSVVKIGENVQVETGDVVGCSQSQAFRFPFARVDRPGAVSALLPSLLVLSGVACDRLELEANWLVGSVGAGSL